MTVRASLRSVQVARFSPLLSLALAMFFLPFASGCLSFHRGPMPGEPKAATYARLEGARVRYSDSAEGAPDDEKRKPAVVMVHGFASSLETWVQVAPAVRRAHRVVSLDLKGFGWTDRPEGDYSPEAQARIVLRLMDHLGIARASLVAHSWGSSVALSATLAAPERVDRIALYDAWIYEEQLPVFFQWARASGVGEMMFATWYKERADERMALAFFDRSHVTEELIQAVDAALERPGTVAAALAAVRGQRFASLEGRYRSITKKALLLWGREDIVALPKYGERLARELPGSRLVMYPRCGHFPMIEAREASTRDLVAFLEEGEASPAASAGHGSREAP